MALIASASPLAVAKVGNGTPCPCAGPWSSSRRVTHCPASRQAMPCVCRPWADCSNSRQTCPSAARKLASGMAWEKSGRLAALMGAIKIAHRGGQNHLFAREQIAERYRAAFGHSLW